MTQENTNNKPVHNLKSGKAKAAIFARECQTKEGKAFTSYNVAISRAFTRDDGKTWEYSDFMDYNSLLDASLLYKMAKEWIDLQKEA
jgi:hypothetical protein